MNLAHSLIQFHGSSARTAAPAWLVTVALVVRVAVLLRMWTCSRHERSDSSIAKTAEPSPGPDVDPRTAAPGRDPSATTREVLIMGPPRVIGVEGEGAKRSLELLVMLALERNHHAPGDVLRGRLCDCPDAPMAPGCLRQLVEKTTEWLGTGSDEQPSLLHIASGYGLHPEISVDWECFLALVSSDDIEDLRAAMSLVRGAPLEGCSFWWLDMLTIETMRSQIVEVAEHLALSELHEGLPNRAVWAANRGLLADPYAESLYQLLMRAESDAGNPFGVHHVYERWLRQLKHIRSTPHPSTKALYRELTSGDQETAASTGVGQVA